MYPINLPSVENYKKIFTECVEGFVYASTIDKRNRLLNSIDDVLKAGDQYHDLASGGRLAEFLTHDICGQATKSDLKTLYEEKFVPEGNPGNDTYQYLKTLAYRNICPLCSHLPVETLDHYLPKSKYPSVALYPRNLVPSCRPCNENKSTNYEILTIHPYYEDFTNEVWLKCIVFEKSPVIVTYTIEEDAYDENIRKRLLYHLTYLKIDRLYKTQAIFRLADLKYQFLKLFNTGGSTCLKKHITNELESLEQHRLNSWNAALYRALTNSDWFLNGGVREIA